MKRGEFQDDITGVTNNSQIYSVKVLDENDKTTVSKVVAGIYWAIENDIDSEVMHKELQDAQKTSNGNP